MSEVIEVEHLSCPTCEGEGVLTAKERPPGEGWKLVGKRWEKLCRRCGGSGEADIIDVDPSNVRSSSRQCPRGKQTRTAEETKQQIAEATLVGAELLARMWLGLRRVSRRE